MTVLHLYPKELNLYGDSGNVICLLSRLKRRGIKAEYKTAKIGEKLPGFDILFIGGGQDSEMEYTALDIRKKSDRLRYEIENGKCVLAICGGYQLLGEYYIKSDGKKIKTAGVFPFKTVGMSDRMIGNFVFETPFGKVVGFENHAGRTYLSDGISPLGKLICGFGNNGEDGFEGAAYKNAFLTYAHGPVLVKNPKFADEIIKRAAGCDLPPIDDELENLCHNALIKRYS